VPAFRFHILSCKGERGKRGKKETTTLPLGNLSNSITLGSFRAGGEERKKKKIRGGGEKKKRGGDSISARKTQRLMLFGGGEKGGREEKRKKESFTIRPESMEKKKPAQCLA